MADQQVLLFHLNDLFLIFLLLLKLFKVIDLLRQHLLQLMKLTLKPMLFVHLLPFFILILFSVLIRLKLYLLLTLPLIFQFIMMLFKVVDAYELNIFAIIKLQYQHPEAYLNHFVIAKFGISIHFVFILKLFYTLIIVISMMLE